MAGGRRRTAEDARRRHDLPHGAHAGESPEREDAQRGRVDASGGRVGGLAGRAVAKVEARGKNLLVHFDDGRVLHTHMRMTGSWHVYRHAERWQRPRREARVVLATADFVIVCFSAPVVRLLTASQLARDAALRASARTSCRRTSISGRRADGSGSSESFDRRGRHAPVRRRRRRQRLQVGDALSLRRRSLRARRRASRSHAPPRPREGARAHVGQSLGRRARDAAEPDARADLGLRAKRPAVPALRDEDPHAPPGRGRPVDVLVSGVPAGPGRPGPAQVFRVFR